jgi:hypothetical protein
MMNNRGKDNSNVLIARLIMSSNTTKLKQK